jgi:hypothetical protein
VAKSSQHLHLTYPRLDPWVTVEAWARDGRYMATADLGEDSRDVGLGEAHGWPAATLTDNGAIYTTRFTGG